jgi:hypothetical protein
MEAVMIAKRFFYVSAGLLCLALAYHLGARSATAQAPGNPVVEIFERNFTGVVTANGDVYQSLTDLSGPWVWRSNVFGTGPTPAQRESWGSVKSRYRGERGAAQPAPQGR